MPYNCEIGFALGEPGGSWTTVPIEGIEDFDDNGSLSVEEYLLVQAREEAFQGLDARVRDFVAYVWVHSYEWVEADDDDDED